MARLNIDYKLERNEPTFRALQKKLGSEAAAWEMLLRFRDIAQDWYRAHKTGAPVRSGISEMAFGLEGDLEVMIEVGYAFRSEDGVHAVGEDDLFGWLLARKEGGKTRAKGARNEDGTLAGDASASSPPGGDQLDDSTSSSWMTQPAPAGLKLDDSTSSHPASSSLLLLDSSSKTPFSPPRRSGASAGRDADRQSANAAAEVIAALVQGWSPERLGRELSTVSLTLVAKRWGRTGNLVAEWVAAKRKDDMQPFLAGLRADFRALGRGLPARAPPAGRNQSGKRDDTMDPGGPT